MVKVFSCLCADKILGSKCLWCWCCSTYVSKAQKATLVACRHVDMSALWDNSGQPDVFFPLQCPTHLMLFPLTPTSLTISMSWHRLGVWTIVVQGTIRCNPLYSSSILHSILTVHSQLGTVRTCHKCIDIQYSAPLPKSLGAKTLVQLNLCMYSGYA